MSKIAVIGVPLYGHVRPVVPLLHALHERGFEVHYYNSARFAGVARETNCVFVGYDSLLEADPDVQPCLIFLHREIPHALKQLEKDILRQCYGLVLYDNFCLWTKYLVMLHRLRAMELFTTYPNAWIRDTSPSRLVHMEYEDATLAYIAHHDLAAYTVDCPARKPVPRAIGLYDLQLLDRALKSPQLNCPDWITAEKVIETPAPANLVFAPEEFMNGPPEKPGASYHFLPSLYRLHTLKGGSGEKLIYASFGTRSNIIERLIAAWLRKSRITGFKLHVAAGPAAERLQRHSGPELTIERFADQHALLARADVFITHGGMNGIMEAILTETPMLVIPLTFEQEITARNIQKFQLGMHCSLARLETIDLQQLIMQLLGHAAIRENLKTWRARILAAGGAARAVELIEQYI